MQLLVLDLTQAPVAKPGIVLNVELLISSGSHLGKAVPKALFYEGVELLIPVL